MISEEYAFFDCERKTKDCGVSTGKEKNKEKKCTTKR